MNTDWMRTIRSVEARGNAQLALLWSDGTAAEIAVPPGVDPAAGDPEIGDWGHALVWPDGSEAGADRLWLETLTAIGRPDARAFLEWRMKHGLSLTRAGEELGISRRTVANYSNGSQPVPKAILLACRGWSAIKAEAA
ncbi:hypothetical protein ACLBKU_12475 [Erythrobacter sp. NE805]|uniref:hypothetical protein n=1 Tax=Erythrobacter sp. NE805 TaxID=3389875 RepID=UPI00396B3534